ncbi:histidine kinase [Agromyces silvae]|uniref:histidine kinase n=1 Tax=Agromyces silvae TaxID=3388266 RepID=UPI00280AC51D|nr:histidine kinase [Agromyces protaetiae]
MTATSARRAVAIGVWAVSWVLALASLVIAWAAALPTAPLPGVFLSQAPLAMRASFDDIGVTVALIYGPVAALILARRPHPVGVILAIHAVGSGIAAFGVQYGLLGAEVEGLPLWGLAAFAAGWGFVPGTFMTAALPLLVTRQRVPRWQLALVIVCAAIAAVAFVASLTQQSVPEPQNPFAIDDPAYQAVLPGLYTILSFAAVGISLVSCGVLVQRWATASGRDRVGLAWLTLGHVFLTASYLALVLPEGLALPTWIVDFGLVAPVLGQVLYPAAILVVVLGQRLWGVEFVVSRVILWSLLSISGVILYLVVVLAVPRLLPGADGAWLLAPILIAVAVQPIRRWLQRRIDRLIYGDGAEPAVLLTRLGDRIGELEPGPAGLRELSDALRRVLRLGSVEVRSESSAIVEVAGAAGGDPVVVPLVSRGHLVGELVVRPIEGQRFDRRTLAVLDDVAGLVAAAVQLVESNLVLERARGDLVAKRAGERRALRRELHDGLGPALAGIGFGLAAVENLLPANPDRAGELLDELAGDLARRARDVRELAGEVTPSPLDGATLAQAVDELARRFDSDGLRVVAAVEAVPILPAPVQDALYFIAAEALANAVRHARATRIEVSIAVRGEGRSGDGRPGDGRPGDLAEVLVVDDGQGLPAAVRPGVGLASMRERAEEQGGTLSIERRTRGTLVRALIPARRAAPVEDMAH